MAGKRFYNNVNKPFILVKWKIEANHCIFSGSTVLTYVYQKDFSESKNDLGPQKLKSSVHGIVLSLLVKEGDVVQPGAPLLEFDACSHEIVLKGICASCGVDTWSFPVLENFGGIGLTVTEEQAKLLKKAGEDKLLRRRKLALFICVDQILVNINNTSKPNLHHNTVKLLDPALNNQPLSTKLLPGAHEFLENISDNYDIHFFTHGGSLQRLEICRVLKTEFRRFQKHVWTAEDFQEASSNEEKLEVVFPNGHSMVCVVDCHEDMWKSDGNIVFIKSRETFMAMGKNTDDSALTQVQTQSDVDSRGKLSVESSEQTESKTVTDNLNNIEFEARLQKSNPSDVENEDMLLSVDKNNYTFQNHNFHYESASNYMLYLKTILNNIHHGYYELLNQMIIEQMYVIHQQVIPHLKFVIPYVRQSILKGVNLVFSGLIPTNVEPKSCPFWTLAESLGASVANDLVLHDKENGTTHIIAAKVGTNKLNAAKHFKNIYIVTIEWLYDCAFRWDHVNEKYFLLKDDTTTTEETNIDSNDNITNEDKQKIASACKKEDSFKQVTSADIEDSSSSSTPNTSLHVNINLTSEELDKMAKEVEHEIAADDSDDEKPPSRNSLMTVKRKIRNEWNFHPIRRSLWKQKRCDPYPQCSSWYDDENSNTSFPEWELPCDNDSNNVSESESPMVDYIWSEDEDNLLSHTESDLSNL